MPSCLPNAGTAAMARLGEAIDVAMNKALGSHVCVVPRARADGAVGVCVARAVNVLLVRSASRGD
jgi:hypothetical protein